jgi:ubiquinone/menaquinone biosynthesis C-methylase UbiE
MSDRDYFKRAVTSPLIDKISFSVRRRIFGMFLDAVKPLPNEKIIDIGAFAGSEDPNQNFMEQLYKHPENITAVGIEDASFLERQYPGLKFIKIVAGKKLPFDDDQFDIGFSSATIEHVGTDKDQEFFLRECLRVSRRLFLVTPNRFYPVEFHTRVPFLHWLPKKAFGRILKMIGLEFYSKEENLNLLDRKKLLKIVPDRYRDKARLEPCRFLGITSNLILVIRKRSQKLRIASGV